MMDTFVRILVSWFPMLVLIAVWIFFMRKMKSPQDKTVIYLEKQNELIKDYINITERIATSLEKISEKKNK